MSVATLDPARPQTAGPKRIQGGLLDPNMLLRSLPDALRWA